MATSSSSSVHLFLFSITFAFILSSNAATLTPSRFVLPIKKDDDTLQYFTEIGMGTPANLKNVFIDLGGEMLWIDCENNYNSSTYRTAPCGSPKCKVAKARTCLTCNGRFAIGCSKSNNTCGVLPYNPIGNWLTDAGVGEDIIRVHETDGNVYLNQIDIPNITFPCSYNSHLEGLAHQMQGVIGLGRTRIAFPTEVCAAFNIPTKFALCTPSSNELGFGSMFIGGGPYFMHSYGDASKLLVKTPLLINPVSTAVVSPVGDPSYEYFIGVKSIKIAGKVVSFNSSLLSIDRKTGDGGTKLSTIKTYTTLHSEIYTAFVRDFVNKAASMKMSRVSPVAPFGACYSSKRIASTITGPSVPTIDLELEGNANWRIYGANSMVKVNKSVICLAFVDAGPRRIEDGTRPTTSIVLGTHQLADNLLEFDLSTSKLGFTSSLLHHNTSCSQSRMF